ncbi:MAG: hypothetical protein ACREX6_04780, partial [Casimicrobiaceae bacterium]
SVTLHAAAEAMRARHALTRAPRAERKRRQALDALRTELGAAAFDAASAIGSAYEKDETLSFARATLAREPALA